VLSNRLSALARPSASYQGVALVAPVTFGYQRYSDHGASWFIGRTLAEMIEAIGIQKHHVDGLAVTSFSLVPDSVVMLADQFNMSPRWIEQITSAGANGPIMARRAARAVQSADAEIVACISAGVSRPGGFRDVAARFSRDTIDSVYPYGAPGPNGVFAMMTRYYMQRFKVTREDFGRICIAQRENARHVPHALMQKPMSMEDYLQARPIAEPLHLFDCVMPCAGAEGFLVMTEERARSLQLPYAVILAADERHNAYFEDEIQIRGGWASFSEQLYVDAGLGPGDMDFLQCYDDYPVIVMQQLEDLGFCDKGEGASFVRETPLTWNGGGLPTNTSGGQLSAGQAGAAGGALGMVEGIRQLTKTDLDNHVTGGEVGLVSGYGMASYNHCLATSATIIARGPR